MIISIDAQKEFDKFQHPSLIKILKKPRIEGMKWWITIKNVYSFGLHSLSWHKDKPLEFPEMRAMKVSFVMLMRWLVEST